MFERFRYTDLIKTAELSILFNMHNNIETYLYDFDDNPNIEDLSKPYSHASLLCDLINKK